VEARLALGFSGPDYGALLAARGDHQAACDRLGQAARVLEAGPWAQDASTRGLLVQVLRAKAGSLSDLGRRAEADADWDRAISLADGPERDEIRLEAAIRRGDYARA